MPIAYVIHIEGDRAFVETKLAQALPPLGFDRWVSGPGSGPVSGDTVFAVVPATASVTDDYCDQLATALQGAAPIVSVYLGRQNTAPPSEVLAALQKMPSLDAADLTDTAQQRRAGLVLMDLLAIPAAESGSTEHPLAQRIAWSEPVFSALLEEAVRRHDYNRGNALLDAFAQHLGPSFGSLSG
jgi:hypothetical protein